MALLTEGPPAGLIEGHGAEVGVAGVEPLPLQHLLTELGGEAVRGGAWLAGVGHWGGGGGEALGLGQTPAGHEVRQTLQPLSSR